MDYSYKRLTFITIYWIIMETQLQYCKGHLRYHVDNYHPNCHQMHYPHQSSYDNNRGSVTKVRPIHIRANRDTQIQNIESRKDESGASPIPMLHWMRQMIFKTKSMYTKHKLEFELSGCFIGFIRKSISLIYNSLYLFNKKLMFAKNIKMEDIKGLGKASSSLSMNVSNSIPQANSVGTHNITLENKSNYTSFENKIHNSAHTFKIKNTDIKNNIENKIDSFDSKIVKNVTRINEKQKVLTTEIEKLHEGKTKPNEKVENEPSEKQNSENNMNEQHSMIPVEYSNNNYNDTNATNELDRTYVKLYSINEQLDTNINKINTLYYNITKDFDNLKDTINKISKQKVRNHNFNSQILKDNISQSIVTNENQLNNSVTKKYKKGRFNEVVFESLKGTHNSIIIHGLNNKREEHERDYEPLDSLKYNRTNPEQITFSRISSNKNLHMNVISQNEILKQISHVEYKANSSNVENTKKFENHSRYNFTTNQLKIISNRVKKLLGHLSKSADQSEAHEILSRQFSQDSVLDSINSVILYFLGFTPEEESLEYFMSLVGKETGENLLRIGSGFNAMRNSQLFSCMTHYGSTKFWNWIDSCC